MKRFMQSFLAVALLMVTVFASSASAAFSLRVVVDGKEILFPDAQPFIDSKQRVQLPIRFVSEALGAKVLWDASAKKVTITLDGKTMVIRIGQKSYQVNGKTKQMDTAAIYKQYRTFVPLRFIYEGLGVDTRWEDAVKTVYINTSTGGSAPTPTQKPTPQNTTDPKTANVHGFKVSYVEMAPNEEPGYRTNSQLTVWENVNPQQYEWLLAIQVDFESIGADPIKGMQEAEAILRQRIEGEIVDDVMNYVKKKTKRSQGLPEKVFESKDYEIVVASSTYANTQIAIYKKGNLYKG
ncbi:copper amine oxidase N-terminal domain-containing protein [Paenibacillus sp. CN-4]|uniref:copper amine oxidase N-terminal domain-containing protein n=1 Tax=Paenibacillus nanchangensis TaxID=3348343 RepID=UPI00397A504D